MLARKENGGKVLLKMGFLIPKTLRMKNLDYLKKWTLKAILKKNKRKKWKVARGQWWPCKTGRACGSSAQVRLPSVHITDIGLKKS